MNIQVVRKFPQIKSKTLFSQHTKVVIPQRKSYNLTITPQSLHTNPTSSYKFSKWLDVQTQKSLFSPRRQLSTHSETKSSDTQNVNLVVSTHGFTVNIQLILILQNLWLLNSSFYFFAWRWHQFRYLLFVYLLIS